MLKIANLENVEIFFLILEMALNLRFWEIRIKFGTFLEFYKFRKIFLHGRTIRAPEISKLVKSSKKNLKMG